jgi:hypothetical protein
MKIDKGGDNMKAIWGLGAGLFIVGMIYFLIDFSAPVGDSNLQLQSKADISSEVRLTNGETLNLTEDEAALKASSDHKKVALTNLGMTCSSCKAAVSAGLKSTKGIIAFYVNLSEDRATLSSILIR